MYDLTTNTLYSFVWFDNRFLSLSINASTGISNKNRCTNNFGTSWSKVYSSIQQESKIYSLPWIDSIQYLFIYDTISDSFSNHLLVSTSEFYYSLVIKSYIMYMLGSNSPSLSSKWNISKTCLQSFDHVDLSITTNNTRVLGSTEYQLGTSSLISNTSLYTVMTSSTAYPVEASLTINTSPSNYILIRFFVLSWWLCKLEC